MLSYRISKAAEADIEVILDHSLHTFGEEAALRYQNLLKVSINTLRKDVNPPGASATLRELSKFHISMCKKEAQVKGVMVATPRHIIFFRVSNDLLEIVRVLHDSIDFDRHI
jgi:toxin ParE1/3/4|tara:strand:- start:250 stop:585 length:336 start_codon:yes stop_codon:yes gene_type:complete